MQDLKIHLLRRSAIPDGAGFLLMAILLLALAGCVTTGKSKPEPVEKEVSLTEKGPGVTKLTDGREGFIIRETPHLAIEVSDQFERAVVMLEQEDYENAAPLLEKVIEQSPGVTAPYIDLAIACRHLGRPEEAEKHLKTALELFPGHPVASNEYGLLLRKAGRFAEARTIYEKALSTFPDYQPVRKNLGILCDLYLRDPACALEQYEDYSRAMPNDEKVKLWIADLQMRFKQ